MFLVKWVPFINHSGKKSKREGEEGRGRERGRRRDINFRIYYNGLLVKVRIRVRVR